MAGRNIRNGTAYGSETVVGIYSCCKRLDFVRCIKNDRVIKVALSLQLQYTIRIHSYCSTRTQLEYMVAAVSPAHSCKM